MEAVRWTNASIAAIWRTFDDRRRETQPDAPMLLDMMDSANLEKSTICSQLVRYPQCVAHATAFLATVACRPGGMRFGTAADSPPDTLPAREYQCDVNLLVSILYSSEGLTP